MDKVCESCQGWMGSLSRIEAEHKLDGKPVGTYLLREGDGLTASTAFHLAQENLLEIVPYLLTVVEGEEKIADILIIQTNRGWILYHDDPNLSDKALYTYFPTLRAVLDYLKPIATRPVLTSSSGPSGRGERGASLR